MKLISVREIKEDPDVDAGDLPYKMLTIEVDEYAIRRIIDNLVGCVTSENALAYWHIKQMVDTVEELKMIIQSTWKGE